MNFLPKVIFTHVKDNQTKIGHICQTVYEAINKKKRILILVQNEEAAKYIDSLLWRFPEESFLPHSYANKPTKENIVVTTINSQNLNQAAILLNLSPSTTPIFNHFEEIHELYDETSPPKVENSKLKIKSYQSLALNIIEK
ncbi:MAG: DNA polymerase III subunit chi [Parachlamydiaceae bacterium]|nr:DNA polymerase III subunit chi [Parachlamydiaceae bacterium]